MDFEKGVKLMKKGLMVFLALLLVLSVSLIGCGQQKTPTTTAPAKSAEPAKAPEPAKAAAWVPDKPIELVVPYSAGGGSDIYARVIADIAQKNKFSPQPIMVNDKPGGNGQVGNVYVYSKKGDKYTLITYVSGQDMSAIAEKAEVDSTKLTPIANVALDEYTIGVSADSKYKTINDLVDASKAAPDTITVGGSGKGNEDETCVGLLSKFSGAKFKYVSFNGSGDVMAAMLGGHIQAGIFNPNEILSQLDGGKAKVLAVYGTKRLGGSLKDVPTFGEAGYKDLVFQQYRGIAAPPGIPEEVIKFYEDMFKKITDSNEWKTQYWEKNLLTNHYLNSADFKKFQESEKKKYTEIFKDLGYVK